MEVELKIKEAKMSYTIIDIEFKHTDQIRKEFFDFLVIAAGPLLSKRRRKKKIQLLKEQYKI